MNSKDIDQFLTNCDLQLRLLVMYHKVFSCVILLYVIYCTHICDQTGKFKLAIAVFQAASVSCLLERKRLTIFFAFSIPINR